MDIPSFCCLFVHIVIFHIFIHSFIHLFIHSTSFQSPGARRECRDDWYMVIALQHSHSHIHGETPVHTHSPSFIPDLEEAALSPAGEAATQTSSYCMMRKVLMQVYKPSWRGEDDKLCWWGKETGRIRESVTKQVIFETQTEGQDCGGHLLT